MIPNIFSWKSNKSTALGPVNPPYEGTDRWRVHAIIDSPLVGEFSICRAENGFVLSFIKADSRPFELRPSPSTERPNVYICEDGAALAKRIEESLEETK